MLAIPLAIRLAVPPPEQAMLGNAQAVDFADALVTALQSEDVPVIASATPLPLDWLVEITAERKGQSVRPRFRLLDADRKLQATTDGTRSRWRTGPMPTASCSTAWHRRPGRS